MCELLVVHYSGCEHTDHLPGKLHEMPIYCPNLQFVEAGVSATHALCLMCRASQKEVQNAKAKVLEDGNLAAGREDEKGKEQDG